MSTWPMVALGDVAELKYGKSLPAKSRRAGKFAVYGSNGRVGSHDKSLSEGATIIVGRKGSFGEIHYSSDSSWPIDTTYFIDGTSTEQDLNWLQHMLPMLKLTTMNRSAAVPGLNREDAYRKRLPLPPLVEQRRIAAILDQAQGLQRTAKHQLNLLLSIESSLFTRAHLNPSASMQTLGELRWDFTSGKNIVSIDGSSHPTNRVIKVSAASSGTFLSAESKPLPLDYDPPENHRITEGDILFCRASGSLDLIGRTAKVDAATNLFLPDKVWRLRLPVDGTPTRYALGVLRSRRFLDFVRYNASGAAGVKNISKKKVLSYPVALPGIETQASFASEAQALDTRIEVAEARRRRLNELASTLRSRAFRGEL